MSTNAGLEQTILHCVHHLGHVLGERNDRDDERYAKLGRARDYIVEQLSSGGGDARILTYRSKGVAYENIELRLSGTDPNAPEIIVGAHYDTARKAPGANDNGTGIACLLALSELLQHAAPRCAAVRLVAFANEEPPHTRKPSMGSLVYARALSEQRVAVRGMISLETLSPVRSRVFKPVPLFVVGNLRSRRLCRDVAARLGHSAKFVSRSIVAPGALPGVRSSDHWSFWQLGMPAVMITAGGPLTYWHYHRPSDSVAHTPTDHLSEVAVACSRAIQALAEKVD